MSLIFKIGESGKGEFYPKDKASFKKLDEQIKDIMLNIESSEESILKSLKSIEGIIEKDPLFLRAYPLMAELYAGLEDDETAAECFRKAVEVAREILPDDFAQAMDMDNIDVQCYIRCHSGYVDVLASEGKFEEALQALQRHLLLDPGDMFERGREKGELLILAGKLDEAESVLLEDTKIRNEAWYSLGYLSFINEKYAAAAAYIRKAFVMSPYAGDFIRGTLTPPNIFWEQGPMAPNHQDALAYVELMGGELWFNNRDAMSFLEYMGMSSCVLAERAAAVSISERLFGNEDFDQIKKISAEQSAILNKITEESSEKLVELVNDPCDAEALFPWQLLEKTRDDHNHGDGCDCGCGH